MKTKYKVLTGFAVMDGYDSDGKETNWPKDVKLANYVLEGDSIKEILDKQILQMLAVMTKHEVESKDPNADFTPRLKEYLEKYKIMIKE